MTSKPLTPRLVLLSVTAAMFLLVMGTEHALSGAARGVDLFLGHVLPSTFPFMVLSSLMGRLLAGQQGLKAVLSALLVGNLSGYPAGGQLCGAVAKEGGLTGTDRLLLLVAGIGAGPGFTMAAVGAGILHSPSSGLLLYGSQLLTALSAALPLLIRLRKRNSGGTFAVKVFSFADIFVSSVRESCLSALAIGGYVIFFSCFLGVLEGYVSLTGLPGMAVSGLLEISSSCGRASLTYGAVGFSLLGGLLGFGGLSVFCQLTALTDPYGIPVRELLFSRLWAFVGGTVFSFLLYRLFPSLVLTSTFEPGVHQPGTHPLSLSMTLCFLVVVLLLCDRRTAELRLPKKNTP